MIYIVNGAPCAGKTTFENIVKNKVGGAFCSILSTIDFVKKIAKECGWNGEKTPENRKFLSDLKDLLTNWDNVPFKQITKQVDSLKSEYEYYSINENRYIIFIDCREPKEIKKLCDFYGCKSILVSNKKIEENKTSNHADNNVLQYNYDIIIDNNSSLADLEEKVDLFLKQEGF